jgi:hypothetical protein
MIWARVFSARRPSIVGRSRFQSSMVSVRAAALPEVGKVSIVRVESRYAIDIIVDFLYI